eukprot:11227165-Lingulodinium_polyedra.AAC.1
MDLKDLDGLANSDASPRPSPESSCAGEAVAGGRGTGKKWRRAKGGSDGALKDTKSKQDDQGMPAPKARKAKTGGAPPDPKDTKVPFTMINGRP